EEVLGVLVERMTKAHLSQDEMQNMKLTPRMESVCLLTDRPEVKQKIQELLSDIGRALRQNSGKSRYKYVDYAMEYIAAHYSDGNLSLDEMSKAVGISAPYLSGIFSEVNKDGFLAYLSSYRVEQARKYLTETTETVAEIGKKCGFNSAQSFSRVFRKQTGMSPGQYRDKMKET
ncbi:MAG: helix-turn-helix transcriptional regulator, partial [Lachnospiraceae bacterium]|nr:helix-turn-helix transcriptional regulator [Lachnospiraceae bacterium]